MRLGIMIMALYLLAGLAGKSVQAWGPQGHALIAYLAEAHISPETQTRLQPLLDLENKHTNLADIASWADAIRGQRRHTGRWHYVSIPLHAQGYQAERDCPDGQCVVKKISHFARILQDRQESDNSRLEALKFVVHFMGDIAQPMHAVNDNDWGGNAIKLHYLGQNSNLHKIWDSGIIKQALRLYVGPGFTIDHEATRLAAQRLNHEITATQKHRWTTELRNASLEKAAIAWANESHQLARQMAYETLPRQKQSDWEQAYQEQAWPVVKRQIQRSAIRLAWILDQLLADEP